MSRILITGSSDGLGAAAAKQLIKDGHKVVLHARNEARAKDATSLTPGAESVLIGDLSIISGMKKFASDANDLGPFDAVIHNAGVYRGGLRKTEDGVPLIVAVNTLAPYVLTCLMERPKKMLYLSSSMHNHASPDHFIKDITYAERGEKGFNDTDAYCVSKVHNVLFANTVARRWPDVQANSLDPGWVPTKMGGASAPETAEAAVVSYEKLAVEPGGSGAYFTPGGKKSKARSECDNMKLGDELMAVCEELTGVKFPTA